MTTGEATVQDGEPQMVRTSVHLEVELFDKLNMLAEKADRSFAAEVRRRLRKSVESENGKARA